MAEVKKNEFFSHLVADVLHRVVNRSCLSLEPDDFPICSLAACRVDVDVARARRIGVLHVKQLRNDQLRDCRHQLSETMTEYRRSRGGESCQHQVYKWDIGWGDVYLHKERNCAQQLESGKICEWKAGVLTGMPMYTIRLSRSSDGRSGGGVLGLCSL